MIKNADILDSLNNLFGAQRISKGQEQIVQKLSPIVQNIKEKGLVQPWKKAIPKLPVDQWKSTISDSYGKFNRAATYMLLSGLVGGALGYGAHRLNNRRLKRFKKEPALNLGQMLLSIYGFGALGALTGYGLYKFLNKKNVNNMGKAAASKGNSKRISYKTASLRGDVAGDLTYNTLLAGSGLLPFYYLASEPGIYFTASKSKRGADWKSALPAVGAQRVNMALDANTYVTLPGHARSKRYSQTLSPFTSLIVGALAGAGIGAVAGDTTKGIAGGALLGAGAGAASSLLALALAAATPTWSKEKTKSYMNTPQGVKNLLIPGLGTYNRYKRIGRAIADQQQAKNSGTNRGKEKDMNKKASYREAYSLLKNSGVVSQDTGIGLNFAVPAALAAYDRRYNSGLGTAAWGTVGAANLIAAIAALATKTRTEQEQRKASRSVGHTIANLSIPGWATYNRLKRIGQSWKEDRDYDKKIKEQNENKVLEKKQYLQSLQEQNQANTFHQITNNSKQSIQKLTQMPRAVENKKQGQTKVTVQTPPGTPAQQFTRVN